MIVTLNQKLIIASISLSLMTRGVYASKIDHRRLRLIGCRCCNGDIPSLSTGTDWWNPCRYHVAERWVCNDCTISQDEHLNFIGFPTEIQKANAMKKFPKGNKVDELQKTKAMCMTCQDSKIRVALKDGDTEPLTNFLNFMNQDKNLETYLDRNRTSKKTRKTTREAINKLTVKKIFEVYGRSPREGEVIKRTLITVFTHLKDIGLVMEVAKELHGKFMVDILGVLVAKYHKDIKFYWDDDTTKKNKKIVKGYVEMWKQALNLNGIDCHLGFKTSF